MSVSKDDEADKYLPEYMLYVNGSYATNVQSNYSRSSIKTGNYRPDRAIYFGALGSMSAQEATEFALAILLAVKDFEDEVNKNGKDL